MKKAYIICLLAWIAVITVGCGTNKTADKFMEQTKIYNEIHQKMMAKQIEKPTLEFEELSQQAKNFLESDEYIEWEEEGKKLTAFKLAKNEKKYKGVSKLQTAIEEYNLLQSNYCHKLAEARDEDTYYAIINEYTEKLYVAEDKFIERLNTVAD
ncbi:hypothetical protein IGI37_000204 [Enterococcus sp. AZ194]|uniref:hypothetical protein n=1 Tax=Enterococcus sp. AZ194 TaxID=2774629 RepID=UPI003F20A31A